MVIAAIEDRRVRRTRDLLRDAVLELGKTRDLTDLTVQDITRQAEVNRATFYQHYRDKDELIDQTLEGLLEELFAACGPVLAGVEHLRPDEVHPSVVALFRQVSRRAELYGRLIGNGGSASFVRRFQVRNDELSLVVMGIADDAGGKNPIPAEVRARFGTAATLGLLGLWLERGGTESAETMAAWLWQMVRAVWFDGPDETGISTPSRCRSWL